MRGNDSPPHIDPSNQKKKKKKRGKNILIILPPPSTRLDDTEVRTGRSPLTERSHAGETNRTLTARRIRRREQKPSAHREEDTTPESDGKTACGRLNCFLKTKAGPTVAEKAHTIDRI